MSTSAVAAAATGAWAGFIVDLWCPIAEPAHVLFGHSFPILLLAIAGALLGQRYVGVPEPS